MGQKRMWPRNKWAGNRFKLKCMFFPVFLTAKQYCQIFQRNDSQQGNKIRNTLLQKLEALLRGTHGKRKKFGTKILSAIMGSSRLSLHAHLIELICAQTPPPPPPTLSLAHATA